MIIIRPVQALRVNRSHAHMEQFHMKCVFKKVFRGEKWLRETHEDKSRNITSVLSFWALQATTGDQQQIIQR